MLNFVKAAFRGLFVVFLWLNLIGNTVSGLVVGWKLGGGGGAFLGLIVGVVVGVVMIILFGGLVATILCIEDKLDGLDNKYTTSQRQLETMNAALGRIERGMSLATSVSVNSTVSDKHSDIEAKLDEIYDAVITRIVALGAFAEYLPGKIGMIAITEIANERVGAVEDVLKVGDKVRVKVIGFERSGSAKLSIKATHGEVKS